jgi:energy-coupling factor transport system permease protein
MTGEFKLGYLSGTSVLHKLDPLTKLIALAGVILFAIGASPLYNVLMLVGVLFVVPFSGVSFKVFIQPWKVLALLWLPFILFPPIFFHLQRGLIGIQGQTGYLDIFNMHIPYSIYGLNYGLKIAARGTVICIASLLLLWTTHPRELVQSFVAEFRVPYKFAWSSFLALVYVPIVGYEARMRDYALQIRGVGYRKMSLRGIRLYAIPVVMRSLRRGFTTALSMESRGFGVFPDRVFRYDINRPKHVGLIRLSIVIISGILFYLQF